MASGSRKHKRNEKKCKEYRLEDRQAKNKARNIQTDKSAKKAQIAKVIRRVEAVESGKHIGLKLMKQYAKYKKAG